jgi:hypothetical protein
MFDADKLPESYLTEFQYVLCSLSELEDVVRVASKVGIKEILQKKFEDDHSEWAMASLLHNFYNDPAPNVQTPMHKDAENLFNRLVENVT